jgi:anaphase-promoting complex subunit 2
MHEQYEAAFHHFKPDKRLRWLQHIGTAVVKLELEDRVVEVEATPLQASISELYEHQAIWEVQAMSEKLGVDVAQVRNGLAFWANEGVVKEEDGGWRLLEIAEDQPAATSTVPSLAERKIANHPAFVEEEPVIESVDQSKAENVRVHWQVCFIHLSSTG